MTQAAPALNADKLSREGEFVKQILKSIDTTASSINEILRAVDAGGMPAFIPAAHRYGVKTQSLSRSIAQTQKQPFFDPGNPPPYSEVSEHWVMGRDRVLYVKNPFDPASFADYQRRNADRIRAVGIISPPDLMKLINDQDSPTSKIEVGDSGADRWIDDTIIKAAKINASDIHLLVMSSEVAVRFRVDGKTRQVDSIPFGGEPEQQQLYEAISNRLLGRCKLDASFYRSPVDGEFVFHKMPGRILKIRLAGAPTSPSNCRKEFHRYTLRLLGNRYEHLDLIDLGLPSSAHNDQVTKLKLMSEKHHGLIFVTGPTGSGKTTTLSALLQSVKTADNSLIIFTIEDPPEIVIEGTTPIKVTPECSWGDAFKNVLRQDPDIILMGEIRDKPVAEVVFRGAQTGHMVFTTLHTNSAIGTFGRLRDIGIPTFNIADVVLGSTAQRLIPKVCPHCAESGVWSQLKSGKHPYFKSFEKENVRLKYMAYDDNYRDLSWHPDPGQEVLLPSIKGCPKCKHTGYIGRVVCSELIEMNPELSSMIVRGSSMTAMHSIARERYGFLELWEYAMELVRNKVITFDDATKFIGHRSSVIPRPQQRNKGQARPRAGEGVQNRN